MSVQCPGCGVSVSDGSHHNCADAEIAAVTERLRIVEAERDDANTAIGNLQKPLDHIAKLIWGDTQGRPFAILGEAVATELSALRAELERKDAALKDFDWALGQLRHLYIQTNLAEGLKSGLLGPQIERLEKVRAALQPKDKPCQTA